jgi:16S rRNA (guanine966-N2)-methyltransferase
MRIVAGALKGRILTDPKGHRTHPMSEKIRGALFNALGDISGLTLLDAFTGTGAIAIEAISRGAKSVVAIDYDKEAFLCAHGNVKLLRLEKQIKVLKTNAKAWSNNNLDKIFDIVVADPPFDEVNDALLEKIARHCKPEGLLILSLPGDYTPRRNDAFELLADKNYGDAKLLFYRKVNNQQR